MSRDTIFNQPSERFEAPIDWNQRPPDRGFWTDEEMFEATSATSLRLVKSLQRKGLLTASKYKEASKWHRAWTIGDLLVIQLADDVSFHSRFGTDDVASLLSMIPRVLLERALLIDPIIEQITDVYVNEIDEFGESKTGDVAKVFTINRPDDFELIILDRSEVLVRVGNQEFEFYKIGRRQGESWVAYDFNSAQSEKEILTEIANAESALKLNLSRMGLTPIKSQFSLAFEFDFSRSRSA